MVLRSLRRSQEVSEALRRTHELLAGLRIFQEVSGALGGLWRS